MQILDDFGFWIALTVAAVSSALLLYPFVFYPAILKLLPSAKAISRGLAENEGRFSLLFCAYNEEGALPAKLENVRALRLRHPGLEVLAYDDGSNDRTREILATHAGEISVYHGERTGKAFGMKLLASCANADILIFTDANVLLDLDAIGTLQTYFADPEVGGLCGRLLYVDDEGSATAQVGSAYWRLEEWIKTQESRTGNVMGADGSIFALRRELYPEFPDTVLDDLTVSMAAVFAGKRLIKADDVVAREQQVSNSGDEFKRKIRIAKRALHTHLYLRPQLRRMSALDRFKYASRKVIRWAGGLFLILSVASALLAASLHSPIAVVALVSAGAGGIGAIWLLRPRLAAQLWEIASALIATSYGAYRGLRGDVVKIWAPAKSRSTTP